MKVLISSASFGKINDDAINILKDAGYTPILNPYGRKFEINEFIKYIKDAVGLIAGTEKITSELLKNAPQLKAISRYGAGMDNIDLEFAKKMDIAVYSTPEAPVQAVAELAIALMLNTLRRISEVDRSLRGNKWSQLMGGLLFGKKLGIVGLGRIGKRVVKLLQPFGLEFYAYEPYPDQEFVSSNNIRLCSLDDVLSVSDIVTLHLPLSKESFHIIGERELSFMKKDSIIINTSRGGLIDEDALIKALVSNIIGGAGIDVFEKEPYTGGMKDLRNVILTCHMGSAAIETRKQMEIEAVNNLIEHLKI